MFLRLSSVFPRSTCHFLTASSFFDISILVPLFMRNIIHYSPLKKSHIFLLLGQHFSCFMLYKMVLVEHVFYHGSAFSFTMKVSAVVSKCLSTAARRCVQGVLLQKFLKGIMVVWNDSSLLLWGMSPTVHVVGFSS